MMNRTLDQARHGFDCCSGGRRSFCGLVLLALLQLFPVALEAQFSCQTNNGSITISAYSGSSGSVVIPATIADLPVTIIGTNAFSFNLTLGSMTLPDTLLAIETGAFQNCHNLTNLNLSASLATIGDYAFNACWGITNLAFPNSVTNIGAGAFASCRNLATVSLPGNLDSIADQSFNNCFALTSVRIPDSVRNIGAGAFYCCTSLTNVSLSTGVTNLGVSAFAYCGRLGSIAVPAAVASIGTNAFSNGIGAINVDPANPVYSSSEGVLFDHDQGTLIQYPGGRRASSYSLPATVTNIAARAFNGCAWLKSISFGDSLLAIGDYAFQYSGLTNVTFGAGLQSIGKYAFASCPGLGSVMLPASLTNLGACAFYESNLEAVYFKGNAPTEGVLSVCAPVYYLPGTVGWGPYFGNGPTAPWIPRMAGADLSFGTRTNQFGFNIIWARGEQIVIEACSDLARAEWQPLTTNTLPSDISFFTDADSAGRSARFYRLRAP